MRGGGWNLPDVQFFVNQEKILKDIETVSLMRNIFEKFYDDYRPTRLGFFMASKTYYEIQLKIQAPTVLTERINNLESISFGFAGVK